jgi:hypothetical protein
VLLQGFRSLLTDSQDASYLFNAVLDAVVDHTLPLVQVCGTRTLLHSEPRLMTGSEQGCFSCKGMPGCAALLAA